MSEAATRAVVSLVGEAMAHLLWGHGAIRISRKRPFRLTSGNFSPVYINCRQAISDPTAMALFTVGVRSKCDEKRIRTDFVAGGETAGIPFASRVAQSLALPLVYVRKARKGHGTDALVEGKVRRGATVLLVEDLITDAASKLGFIKGITAAGAKVSDVVVMFDRLQGGKQALARLGVRLHSLTDMDVALKVAEENAYVPKESVDSTREYLASPRRWHAKRGLDFH